MHFVKKMFVLLIELKVVKMLMKMPRVLNLGSLIKLMSCFYDTCCGY